ncbi:Vegetative incompatibility protein HET-E-1-like protein 15 [Colletotrichum truncatum]|uniref:Vegetative incompatibility protein HET-E-1-like protein 15 n=1 Tax=Colletotrichum truncatum TaxID=5467 RepID=A0ACC3YYY7_COLTU
MPKQLVAKEHILSGDLKGYDDQGDCAQTTFDGVGVQISGAGNFHAGRDVFIGKVSPNKSRCLVDLRLTDPAIDKLRIEASKGGLIKDLCYWILENPDFAAWRDDPMSRLLWVRGDPGKGKTMLLCGIINELQQDSHYNILGFFFCQATDRRLNTSTAVLRGLLYHLLSQHNHLVSHLQQKYDQGGKELFEDVNAWFSLSEILTNVLQDSSLQEVFLIVDALDECEGDRDDLLDFISKTCGSGRVKWIVSSRNLPEIEEKFRSVPHKVEISLEQSHVSVAAAVHSYIQYKMEHLAQSKRYTPEIRNAIEQYLLSNADNTFLWVALVCQELMHVRAWSARERVKSFPRGLNSLYNRMIAHVRESDDANFCMQILAVATVAYRPISLVEMYHIVDFPEDFPQDQELLEELIQFCGSFLTLRESVVYFVHHSAKEFLQKEAASDVYPAGITDIHNSIFLKSIQVISSILKRNIYRIEDPGLRVDQIRRPDPDPLASLRYSCIHCIDHLYDAIPKNHMIRYFQERNEIGHFFTARYLLWLEAISLLGSVSEVVLSLSKLSARLQTISNRIELIGLIQDAVRFIRYHKTCIETYPLQIYDSALLLSPAQSLIRKVYSGDEPEWINVKPVMEDDWSPCLQTLEGHALDITRVVYSYSGDLLASGCMDGTIRIWETSAGAVTQIINTNKRYETGPISFSADGRLLAVGISRHCEIWDTVTGHFIRTLESHHALVLSLAISVDGNTFASASQDSTVNVSNIATGDLVKTFKLSECDHTRLDAVAFSPDTRIMAAAFHEHGIKIYCTIAGTCTRTIGSHEEFVRSIAFSPDDRMIATGLHDSSVKIRDMSTGVLTHTFEGHLDWVNSVAFSHDGRMIASGSDDFTIKVWDLATAVCKQTLKDHCGPISSVAFSPDSRILASGCADHSIKMWDTSMSTSSHTYKDHSSTINLIIFSPDSRKFASGSDDFSIKVWDAATGCCLYTLSGHEGSIKSITFSPDGGRILVSGSYDNTIRIWDTATGACIRTLPGHSDTINSLVFSDLSTFISASDDCTIKIWDMDTGICHQTLESPDGPVDSIAFSHDKSILAWASDCSIKLQDETENADSQLRILRGHTDIIKSIAFSHKGLRQMIASASYDETIKIWDTATGSCVQNLAMGKPIDKIEFESEQLLRTDLGTVVLSYSDLDSQSDSSYYPLESAMSDILTRPTPPLVRSFGISGGTWIAWNNKKVLWLPSEYWPRRSAISGTTVVIGCRTGRILVFGLSIKTGFGALSIQAAGG